MLFLGVGRGILRQGRQSQQPLTAWLCGCRARLLTMSARRPTVSSTRDVVQHQHHGKQAMRFRGDKGPSATANKNEPRAITAQLRAGHSRTMLSGATGLVGASLAWILWNSPSVDTDASVAVKMCKAAQTNNLKDLQKTVEIFGGNVNEVHPSGWTALHAAAVNDNLTACKYLLENGADIDAQDTYGSGSIHHDDILARQRDFSRQLSPLERGSGMTALHYASLFNLMSVVALLMKNGADPTIADGRGLTPRQYADTRVMMQAFDDYEAEFMEAKRKESEASKREKAERAKRRRQEFPLEKRLHRYIVGQEGPIFAISAAIRRRENGWHDEDTPMVFLFLGSSGVGKTELAKRVAQYVHDDGSDEDDSSSGDAKSSRKRSSKVGKGFIRLDMSEYQEKHEVSKLIGSPPGYVGHGEGGQLTKMLKETPNAVVLLDEVEKAHPDVLTVMLQLFDEGRLTDGAGETVECQDAIFVMTSNLAASEIAEHAWELRQSAEETQQGDRPFALSKEFKEGIIRPILKNHFKRDEFLGRINEIIYFVPFSRGELNALVDMEMEKWQQRARERHDIVLKWTRPVVDFIAEEYDIHFGARSLQHAVDKLIINRLAAAHEMDELKKGCLVEIDLVDGEIVLNTSGIEAGDSRDRSANEDENRGGDGLAGWLFGGGSKKHTEEDDEP